MASPFGGFGQDNSVAGVWFKLDSNTFLGGVFQVILNGTTVKYYSSSLPSAPLIVDYLTTNAATAKFEQVRQILDRLGAFIDLT